MLSHLTQRIAAGTLSFAMAGCATSNIVATLDDQCVMQVQGTNTLSIQFDEKCGQQKFLQAQEKMRAAESSTFSQIEAAKKTAAWKVLAVRAGVKIGDSVQEGVFSKIILSALIDENPDIRSIAKKVLAENNITQKDLVKNSDKLERLRQVDLKICTQVKNGSFVCGSYR